MKSVLSAMKQRNTGANSTFFITNLIISALKQDFSPMSGLEGQSAIDWSIPRINSTHPRHELSFITHVLPCNFTGKTECPSREDTSACLMFVPDIFLNLQDRDFLYPITTIAFFVEHLAWRATKAELFREWPHISFRHYLTSKAREIPGMPALIWRKGCLQEDRPQKINRNGRFA